MKASIIIQARMASTRLPGKILKPVLGRPLISYQIERLKQCISVDNLIVATSIDASNDELCYYLDKDGINYFRGSEDDVLERFFLAASKFNANIIVRLTADCPFIDPNQIDTFIQKLIVESADYVGSGETFAEGLDVEVFTFKALSEAHKKAKKPSEREHVTQYFHNNKDHFKTVVIENIVDDSKYRITVDEEEDLIVAKKIFKALYTNENEIFGIDKIKKFLDQNPEIFKINSMKIRNEGLLKSLNNDNI